MKRICIALVLLVLLTIPVLAFPQLAAPRRAWEFTHADYGYGNNWVDVTDRVRSLIQGSSMDFRVDGDTLGVNLRRRQTRTLRLQFQDERGRSRQLTFQDNQRVTLQVSNVNRSALQINRAVYGSGNRSSDVTVRLNSEIRGDQLDLRVDNASMGGDPAPGRAKTLTVDYALNGSTSQVIINEGDTLRLPYDTGDANQGNLRINRAVYGSGYRTADVTARLNSQIRNDRLDLRVDRDSMGGDPAPGQAKTLTVDYSLDGRPSQLVLNEGETLRLAHLTGGRYPIPGYPRVFVDDIGNVFREDSSGTVILGVVAGGSSGSTIAAWLATNGIRPEPQRPYDTGNTNLDNLQINRAVYGSGYRTSDVTARLNSQIRNDQLDLRVDNASMGGDPAPGQAKTLTVDYALNGRASQVVINEGATLRLPFDTNTGEVLPGDLSQRIRCESFQANTNERKYCPANTRNGVRLIRQIGESACTQGSSWGYDNGGVWVNNGCRGEFETRGAGRPIGGLTTTIPNGTEVSVRTNETIDSRNATVGQRFSAVIAADVFDSSGVVMIPRGSDAELVIRSVNGGNNSTSELVLDVDSLTVAGTRYRVSTSDLEQQGGQGLGANRRTAEMVGGGAVLGTVIGAIAGGGKGAAIGAAVGAGAGAGAEILTKGREVRVPAETLLNFRLDQDLRLQAMR